MRRRTAWALVTSVTVLASCHIVPLEVVDTLNMPGERVPLRAGYWIPREFLKVDPLFEPFMTGVGCGVERSCIDRDRIFPTGIGAVARSVFVESREVPTLEAGFADPAVDVVMAPELSAVAARDFARPLMIRILWRVWAKDGSVVWLDTITSSAPPDGLTRNPRAVAFNRCARDQFQQAANAMRAGHWWERVHVANGDRAR